MLYGGSYFEQLYSTRATIDILWYTVFRHFFVFCFFLNGGASSRTIVGNFALFLRDFFSFL